MTYFSVSTRTDLLTYSAALLDVGYVEDEDKWYQWVSGDQANLNNWHLYDFSENRKYRGGLPIAVGFDLQSNRPLDERLIVPTKADLYTLANCYKHIEVTVDATGRRFKWNGLDQTLSANWIELVNSSDASGTGDMTKAEYDSNDDGKVDAADNADTVNNLTVETAVPAGAVFTDTVYDDTALAGRVTTIEGEQTTQDAAIALNTAKRSYPLADEQKLAGIEAGATADQTKADIDALNIDAATVNGKTVEENVPAGAVFTDTVYDDTALAGRVTTIEGEQTTQDAAIALNTAKNSYPSADATKLAGIEAGATADQVASEVPITDAGGYYSGTDVEAALQEVALLSTANGSAITTLNTNKQDKLAEGAFVDGDKTKLDGIAAGAEVNTIDSITSGEPTGSSVATNVVTLTQAEYDAGTPNANTLYLIEEV